MVDTARTLAEVKALLADNNSGEISPQDMRDMVESIVDPVDAGGFGYGGRLQTFYLFQNNVSISVPNETPILLPIGTLASRWEEVDTNAADPQGWHVNDFELDGADINAAWGTDIPPGNAVMLPPGIYEVDTGANFSTAAEYSESPLKYAQAYIDQSIYDGAGYPYDDDWNRPLGYFYDQYFNATYYGQSPNRPFNVTFTRYEIHARLVNDTSVAKPFNIWGWCRGQTVTRTITSYWCNILRTA